MKVCLALILLSLFACTARSSIRASNRPKPLIVAVVDTGFGFKDLGHSANLCNFGHKDFSIDRQFTKNYATNDPVPLDVHGHGTNVVGLIEREIHGNANYCIVILKYFSKQHTGPQNAAASSRALRFAANIKADIVNYSGGGPEALASEKAAIKNLLNSGSKLIAAAGNENKNLDFKKNRYYPGSYDDRIVVVGNIDAEGIKVPSSNYGKRVTRLENGFEQEAYGLKMTGTSQATAVVTGKIAQEMLNAGN